MTKTASRERKRKQARGKLVSSSSQNPNVLVGNTTFTVGVGQRSHCDLCIGDASVDKLLCTLRKEKEQGGESITSLEVTGQGGSVKVNGVICCNNFTVFLRAGDELVFSTSNERRYIFQTNDKTMSYGDILSRKAANEDFTTALHASIRRGIMDVENIDVSFEAFPYYLSEITKNTLIALAYVHLECSTSKKLIGLSSLRPGILLLDPIGSEIYVETLIKALAKQCAARLLIVNSVLLTGGSTTKEAILKESTEPGREIVSAKTANDMVKLAINILFEVAVAESKDNSLIIFVKDLQNFVVENTEAYEALRLNLKSLSRKPVFIASLTEPEENDRNRETPEKKLSDLLPNKVTIQIPKAEQLKWKQQLDRDRELKISQSNLDNICAVVNRLGLVLNLKNLSIKNEVLTSEVSNLDMIFGRDFKKVHRNL